MTAPAQLDHRDDPRHDGSDPSATRRPRGGRRPRCVLAGWVLAGWVVAGCVFASAGCGGLSTPPKLTAEGGYASTGDLLRQVFRELPGASGEDLTRLASQASQTPGVADAGRYEDPDGMMLRLEPPIDGESFAFIAGWDDVFILPGPSSSDPYVLSLFRQISEYSGSYQQVSFEIPKAGRWRIFAEVDEPPRGPFPKFGSGATGAYPLVDYPVEVNSLTVVDKLSDRSTR